MNIVFCEAFNDVAEGAKFFTFGILSNEASRDRGPCLTALSDRVSQTMTKLTQGSTRKKQLGSKSSRSVGKDGLPSLGTFPESNLFEVVQRDERVLVVHHVTVLLIEGADELGVLRKPSPDDRVVLMFRAVTLNC